MAAILREIRWLDVVDVVVVAIVLGVLISWLRQTRARLALIGLLFLGAIYLTARRLDLQLTLWIFSGFFAAFVVVIVVVFQEELRRIFEQIALWGLRRRRQSPAAGIVDVVTRAAVHLAERRYGALLVLPGREPLDRHLRGGIPLGGRLSGPLLLSLFDKHSPGHDGAVVLSGNEVERFAVHLPLSTDQQQLADVGTRHAAALGLAERTDALCVLVSEERGTVSVAREGRLRALPNPAAVAEEIERFLEATAPPVESRLPVFRMLRSWKEMLIGLGMAIVLWVLLFGGRAVVERTVTVPVRVERPPAGLSLTIDPATVQVSVSARRGDLMFVPKEGFRAVLDGRSLEEGRQAYRLSVEDLDLPPGLTVLRIQPEEIWLTLKAPEETPGEEAQSPP